MIYSYSVLTLGIVFFLIFLYDSLDESIFHEGTIGKLKFDERTY